MHSKKAQTNNYSMVKGKAIAGVVLIPCKGHFQIFVAWEWEDMAEKGFFAIIQSSGVYGNCSLSPEIINEIADYGNDVTHVAAARKLFPNLFKK